MVGVVVGASNTVERVVTWMLLECWLTLKKVRGFPMGKYCCKEKIMGMNSWFKVTLELAELLERLAEYAVSAYEYDQEYCYKKPQDLYTKDEKEARATAAVIRKALR